MREISVHFQSRPAQYAATEGFLMADTKLTIACTAEEFRAAPPRLIAQRLEPAQAAPSY